MVDNRGINPVSGIFKADNASANKMSEEKNGQGGEYFAQEMEEEDTQQNQTNPFQDRSQQLRASLDSLAVINAGSINFKKLKDRKKPNDNNEENKEEEIEETVFDE
jgi:hypothetical protein